MRVGLLGLELRLPSTPPGFLYDGARGRGGNYSATELDEWAALLAALAGEAEVFAYFNNDWKGFAVRNAIDLRERLEAVCHPPSGEEKT